MKFRESFLEIGRICPFTEATTIASACMKVIRKNFLKTNTVGILPARGYRFSDNQSVIAIQWLVWMERELNREIQHAGRCREIRLPINVKVDGFIPPNQTDAHNGICLQMMGCYWHGCIRCFKRNRDKPLSEHNFETLEDRYSKTMAISRRIRANNYELIVKWECEFRMELEQNPEISNYLGQHGLTKNPPLNPREAFYGGRTENFVKSYQVRAGEKINYVDVTSLYPYICKRGKFPLDHLKLYVGEL